jgi:hypothetical protein
MLLVVVANAGTTGPNAPAGWTRVTLVSAGTAQSISVFAAPYAASLTLSFTNAASVAAYICEAYVPDGAGEVVAVEGFAATSNTTNNTTLPTGAPKTSNTGGEYEVLAYCWTSAATITTVATGTTIDSTIANSTSVSASLGHNNTTSLGASATPTAFSQTLSASNTRKTGIGINLASQLVPPGYGPVPGSLGRPQWAFDAGAGLR